MMLHQELSATALHKLIRGKEITLAGNVRLKIYGSLHCTSGKRMKKENRVFFKNKFQALHEGFRPCGHCIADEYKEWKKSRALIPSY